MHTKSLCVSVPLVSSVKVKSSLKGRVRGFDAGELLKLHEGTVHPILSVPQLEKLSVGIPHCSIVVHHETLHSLDERTLDVT